MALSVFLFSTTATFAGNDDNSNKVANEIDVLIEKAEPTYWEGNASTDTRGCVYLKVYQTPGQCNSFVAHIYWDSHSDEKLGEAWVKENPNYNPRAGKPEYSRKYYITYRNTNYYFDM